MLAELAVTDPKAFTEIVKVAESKQINKMFIEEQNPKSV